MLSGITTPRTQKSIWRAPLQTEKRAVFCWKNERKLIAGWTRDGLTYFDINIRTNPATTRGGVSGETHEKITSDGESIMYSHHPAEPNESMKHSFGQT